MPFLLLLALLVIVGIGFVALELRAAKAEKSVYENALRKLDSALASTK